MSCTFLLSSCTSGHSCPSVVALDSFSPMFSAGRAFSIAPVSFCPLSKLLALSCSCHLSCEAGDRLVYPSHVAPAGSPVCLFSSARLPAIVTFETVLSLLFKDSRSLISCSPAFNRWSSVDNTSETSSPEFAPPSSADARKMLLS